VTASTVLKVGGPDAVRLAVCRSCTRTDRFVALSVEHLIPGEGVEWCPGPIEIVTYVRTETPTETTP
jgi:hypothetical protein